MTKTYDEWRWANTQDELVELSRDYYLAEARLRAKSETVRVKRLHLDAKLPEYAHEGDAGADLFANEDVVIKPGKTAIVPTGIAVSLPQGYEWQIRPRSGKSAKTSLRIANAPGTIDQSYRGEVGVIVDNIDRWEPLKIRKGDKIAQAVLAKVPRAQFTEVDELDETDRGTGSFGSTGV